MSAAPPCRLQRACIGGAGRRPFCADSDIVCLTSASGFWIEAAERGGVDGNFLREIRNQIMLCPMNQSPASDASTRKVPSRRLVREKARENIFRG
jgi:hypothetical protein